MQLQKSSLNRAVIRGLAGILCLTAASAHAVTVKVKVENVGASDGLWFTPVFFGFHDGTFDTFDPGTLASTSIENVAEGGDVSGLVGDIGGTYGAKSHVLMQDGSGAPPGVLFAPGESNYFKIDLDASMNKYLSFASMVVPSNDAFFGNPDPMAYELFDAMGMVNKDFEINLFGSNVWDAGTEENDFMAAAFTPPVGMSTDTLNPISLLGQDGLDGFNGTPLAVGGNLSSNLMLSDHIARITVQQVPDSTQYIGFMGAIALIGFRFMSKKRMGAATS